MPKSKKRKVDPYKAKEQVIRKLAPGLVNMRVEIIQFALYACLLVLGDKYGFGKKRLNKFNDYMKSQLHCLREDRVSMKDIETVLIEEYGMDIKKILTVGDDE